MHEMVMLLVVLFIGCVAAFGTAVALSLRYVVVANRLSPRVPTPAPLSWLWSPSAGARLHRRLRRCIAAVAAVAPAREVGPSTGLRGRPRWLRLRGRRSSDRRWPVLADAARGLTAWAAEVDCRVVVAARSGQLPSAQAEVAEVERCTSRLLAVAQRLGAGVSWDGIELGDRLSALEQATRDLDAVQATSGLRLPA